MGENHRRFNKRPRNGVFSTMTHRWKPSVTVAGIIEKEGRYLLVEEHTPKGLMLNNPAGHLDPGESPVQGCIREVLEETAFHFRPTALVGIYLSRFQKPPTPDDPDEDITYLRFAFTGVLGEFEASRPLDTGIVRTLWMSLEEMRQSHERHRSRLLIQCAEDHAKGMRYPLETIYTDATVLNGGVLP
jgi:8-oxo-dGTP pyrophosphatase MutT (NUDIX family)